MLELIFQGFLEWAYGLTLECWQYFSSALLDIMSLDFAYLKTHIPVINDIMQILLAVGWALLIGNLVFQAVKSMASGLGFEGEDPKLLFTRTFVFAFLLLASPQICQIGLDITSNVMAALEIPDAVNVTLVDESVFGGLTAAWLLVIICGVIIMFKVFKLILEIAERYVILAMLTITAPLAFAMGGSRSTSEIFTGWCRMFGSMCVLMATNVIFFKMLLSVLSTVPSGLDVLPWMILIMTIVKVAKKADAIITRIGLNPAITGDSLGSRLPGALSYMVIRTMASQVTKTIGKSTGGSGRGAAPNTPPGGSGGGPRSGGPFGGRSGAGAGVSGYTGQNSTAQQFDSPQNVSQQSSTVQGGTQQTTSKEQNAGSTVSTSSKVNQAGFGSPQSRKSAVPPGTRRAPSHVKSVGTSGSGSGTGAWKRGTAPTSPSATATARQGSLSHMQRSSGDTAAVRSGTAGTGTTSAMRFTQHAAQKVQGGSASASVQAMEKNNISVDGHQHTPTEKVSGQGSGTVPHVPGSSTQKGQPGQGRTRFTHREKAPGKSGRGSAAISRVSSRPAATQPGTAGTGTGRFSGRPAEELRTGRITSSVSTAPSTDRRQSNPAQQEPRPASGSVGSTPKSSSPKVHSGMAGTAATDRQASQMRHTARTQTVRAKSAPTADDSSGGKRAASGTAAARKQHITQKSGSATPKNLTRPPRKKRGTADE